MCRTCRRAAWLGVRTLIHKEVRRFLVVWVQTLLGPIVFSLVLLLIFSLVHQGGGYAGTGVTYTQFLAPGLVVMSMMQNAFANTSSSILIAKQSGVIADILMAPLRPSALTTGFAVGGVARGLVVGVLVGLTVLPFGAAPSGSIEAVGVLLAFGAAATLLFALLGIVGGIWARKMEHIAFMSQVVVAPLTLLSGTFYSVSALPSAMANLIVLNPIFYIIDGFRCGYIGHAESNLWLGIIVLSCTVVALFCLCTRLFATGYGLKP